MTICYAWTSNYDAFICLISYMEFVKNTITVPYAQFITIPYSVFIELMEGEESNADAFAVYYRLLMQVQMQGNSLTESNDKFMKVAMNMGWSRYAKAKALLIKKGLIKCQPVRDDKGRIISHLLEVFTIVEWEQTLPSIQRVKAKLSTIPKTTPLIIQWVENRIMDNDWLQSHPIQNPEIQLLENDKQIDSNNINTINSNIYNNSNIDNNKNINNIIITEVYSKLKNEWLVYNSDKEDIKMAFILSKDKIFLQASEQVGWAETLVKTIMNFAYSDNFWKGKIISLGTFYKHWYKLYTHLKVNKKFAHTVSKQDLSKLETLFDNL